MHPLARDFATLFNALWYRDFPLQAGIRHEGRRAEWTTHIAVCVRSSADLLGYFTHFESGIRTDAVIKDARGTSLANIEWEWKQPRHRDFNELHKLRSECENGVKFSALITYSRDEHHDENLQHIRETWGDVDALLLAFLVRFSYSKVRQFGELETHAVQRGRSRMVRRQAALPWQRPDTRWARELRV